MICCTPRFFHRCFHPFKMYINFFNLWSGSCDYEVAVPLNVGQGLPDHVLLPQEALVGHEQEQLPVLLEQRGEVVVPEREADPY